ncbi:LysR family transcriptional regulator [Thioclava dalianensis]|uniref:LysR family transcriptional regulator n=2 Tax=Thioclava dalianensis TaxID=1185766 RepID=A0A074TH18_9RHOB|nr:LysR family transcriptional regulator [Thioclava dalianensis]
MTPMHPSRFDLNLVKVFLAIWDTRSLTDAGLRLGLTQPAVSHALRRLREQLSDPLFQRVGNQMEPTETATNLRVPFETALSLLEQTLQGAQVFDPAQSTRGFKIAMTDSGEFFAMPRILALLEAEAPNATLSSVRLDPAETEIALRSGQADLAIGYLPQLEASRCHGRLLLRDRMICLMREGHPARAGDWTTEAFARLAFVDVSRAATGYQMARGLIEEAGLGIVTRARLEHFTIVPEVVLQTNYVAIFPHSIFTRLAGRGGFHARDLPFDLPSYEIKLWAHDSFAADPALGWLGDRIVTALREPA